MRVAEGALEGVIDILCEGIGVEYVRVPSDDNENNKIVQLIQSDLSIEHESAFHHKLDSRVLGCRDASRR